MHQLGRVKKGVFPERLKMAKITPIFKKEDSLLNYNLQCFSKISGKLMYNELYTHLAEKNIYFVNRLVFGLVAGLIMQLLRL